MLMICRRYLFITSDNTSSLVHSKAGFELNNIFIPSLNLKITTIDHDKTVLFAFLTYNCTQG